MQTHDYQIHGCGESVKEALKARGICVIIPTYNNTGTLKNVVLNALDYCGDVIVVNDGSTDGTKEILQKIINF